MSCGVIGDELLVVGGQTVRVDCFDTKTKSWRRWVFFGGAVAKLQLAVAVYA